jgi:hypothetical protein
MRTNNALTTMCVGTHNRSRHVMRIVQEGLLQEPWNAGVQQARRSRRKVTTLKFVEREVTRLMGTKRPALFAIRCISSHAGRKRGFELEKGNP